MKIQTILSALFIQLFILTQLGFSQDNFTVKGKIEGWPTETVYLVRQGNYPGVDSVSTTDGSFQFSGSIPGATAAYLITQKKSGVAKLLYVEPGNITVNGNLEDFKNVEVKGSTTYNDFIELREGHEKYDQEMSKYVQLQFTTEDSTVLKQYYKSLDSLSLLDIEYSKEFIKKHPNSIVSLSEIQTLNNSLLNSELVALFNSLSLYIKESPEGVLLSENLPLMGKDKQEEEIEGQ